MGAKPLILRSTRKAHLEARATAPIADNNCEWEKKRLLGHDHPYASANWIRF